VRYVVYGAGAIGSVIGGELANAGHHVVLIGRTAHIDAIRSHGLQIISPDNESSPPVTTARSPEEAAPNNEDVVILAMKSGDTERAIIELDAVANEPLTVVCAQNGVENERAALRRGFNTYAMCVFMPVTYLKPGTVRLHHSPSRGVLDVGHYPGGVDPVAEALARDLRAAGFDSRAESRIIRWKYAKLLTTLSNVLDAACGMTARDSELSARARDEAVACYDAANIDHASEAEELDRYAAMSEPQPVGDFDYPGSSSWQSLARGTGNIETDWLNGEVVLLGRTYGVPTPVNDALRRLSGRLIRQQVTPGSLTLADIAAEVDNGTYGSA
jgi:2-dehydropantoate 2-reductase